MMLERPLVNLTAWTRYFALAPIPALRKTIGDLGALRDREDRTNAREIAATVLQDPLAALNVLAHLAVLQGKRATAEIWTIEESVVMLGVSPFLERFSSLPPVEDSLKAHPEALLGL